MNRRFTVVGIGELLWDIFPEGKRLGGAPANFSYHCQQLGAMGYPVSAVGADVLGEDIRFGLSSRGIDDSFIEDVEHPTGTVQVTLEGGIPNYKILVDVAWDHIPASRKLEGLAQRTDAVSFGSLAQRNEVSRSTLRSFLNAMASDSIRIFDVNLRQSFYSQMIIKSSLQQSSILKLSDEELPVLAEMFKLEGSNADQLEMLRSMFELSLIAYTRGPKGSWLVTANEVNEHAGYSVEAIDSVGAGDAFSAALCMGLLNQCSLAEVNDLANRTAAHVCTQNGATPLLTTALKNYSGQQEYPCEAVCK